MNLSCLVYIIFPAIDIPYQTRFTREEHNSITIRVYESLSMMQFRLELRHIFRKMISVEVERNSHKMSVEKMMGMWQICLI